MGKTVTIKISGRGAETDAPTADDLLDQVRDYLDVIRGVEAAMADGDRAAIEWRIVDASRNSPLSLKMEAFPRQYAVNIDHRADLVTRKAAEGLAGLHHRPDRPQFFTDAVLAKAERIFKRVTNGIGFSEIDFGEGNPKVATTPHLAHGALRNTVLALKPPDRPYKEIGSVEGVFHAVERDGYGRRILAIKERRTGENIKCVLDGNATKKIEGHLIVDVFSARRVIVYGIVHYKGLGRASRVEANDVVFLRTKKDLPGTDQILDENYTGGLATEEYLERLRDGSLS